VQDVERESFSSCRIGGTALVSGQNQNQEEPEAAQLERTLKSRAENGRIDCRAAFDAANELGVSLDVVGETLNKLGIKIAHCQLGCF